MSFNIKSTKDSAVDGVKVLLYANSGTGKTTQLGTLSGKTLVLSAESGLLVLKDKDIDVIDIDCIGTLGQVYNALKSGELVYDNVALDSLTEISDMLVNELEQDEYYGNPSNAFPKWGEYSKRIINIVKLFRDLKGVNVVFVALRESVEANGTVVYMPQIQAKKAQAKLVSMFDEVYYMASDSEGKRIIHTNETSMYVAKTRANIQTNQVLSDEVSIGSIIDSITKI